MASHRIPRICQRCGSSFQQRADRKGIYCSKACYRAPTPTERFWSKVEKTETCWVWIGGKDPDGYGEFWVSPTDRAKRTHRFSWELHFGEIPETLQVLHRCDNPPCIRPDHLFLGTNADNNNDAIAKGRNPLGESHGMAKVTEHIVKEIRRRYREGGVTQQRLADEHGLDQSAISAMVRGQTWKNVS